VRFALFVGRLLPSQSPIALWAMAAYKHRIGIME